MNFVRLIITLAVLTGVVFLQIFLSKRENKLLGLILPLLTFLYALLSVFNVVAFNSMSVWDIVAMLAAVFVLNNIPTLILLAIYFGCRKGISRKKQLEKMTIQDLD